MPSLHTADIGFGSPMHGIATDDIRASCGGYRLQCTPPDAHMALTPD